MIHFVMLKAQSRRNFLRAAPLAAAVALPFGNRTLFAAALAEAPAAAFTVLTAETLREDAKALDAKPGNKELVSPQGVAFQMVMTTEKSHSASEFEWHGGRDHILQVVEGETEYELGGTPKNGRSVKPGEWLAPESVGSRKVTLKQGDMLVIPRGTPHKRSTTGSVTFTLISTTGAVTG